MSSHNFALQLDDFKVKQNCNVVLSCLDGSRHYLTQNDKKYIPEPGYYDGPDFNHSEAFESVNAPEPWELSAQKPVSPYLDIYARTGGVVKDGMSFGHWRSELEDQNVDVDGELREWDEKKQGWAIEDELERSTYCGFTAAVYQVGDDYNQMYYHNLDCRKHWCPVCGGKKGKIHKHRMKAIIERVDISRYNIRQFVLTVPEENRGRFKSRKGLNQLFKAANKWTKRFFGKESAMIAYVHLYGDEKKFDGVEGLKYNPHINVHVFENKEKILKLTPEYLEKLRVSWKRALAGLGCHGVEPINIHYSFRTKKANKIHAIKYMSRPTWGNEHIETGDTETKLFLLIEMKGFQYIRFWGALANCKYEDSGMFTKEEKAKIEKQLGGKLRLVGIQKGVNFELLKKNGELKEISPGFYQVMRKGMNR